MKNILVNLLCRIFNLVMELITRLLGFIMLSVLMTSVNSKSTFTEKDAKHDATEDEVKETVTIISEPTLMTQENIAVQTLDSYSLYKQLMEMKDQLTNKNSTTREPKAVTTLKTALGMLYDSLVDGVFKGFFPHVERQRREASDERRAYLDMAVTTIGAVMGKQNCSRMIACR